MEFRKRANATLALEANSSTPVFGKPFENRQLKLSSSAEMSPIHHVNAISFKNMQTGSKAMKHPSTIAMVCEAINAMGPEKKGVSVQAIKRWITSTYVTVKENQLKNLLKKALVKALIDGTLVRPPRSKAAIGAVGSFCLPTLQSSKKAIKTSANQKTKKSKKVSVSEEPQDYVSDSEVTINKGRNVSMRLHLSDTEIDEVRKSIAFEEKPKRTRRLAHVNDKVKLKSNENQPEKNAAAVEKTAKAFAPKPVVKDVAPAKPPRKTKAAPSKPPRTTKAAANDKENTAPKEQKSVPKAATKQRSKKAT